MTGMISGHNKNYGGVTLNLTVDHTHQQSDICVTPEYTINSRGSFLYPGEPNGFEHAEWSLFVANLPHQMTNEQLAISMFTVFKPFGQVTSIKASRDQRGRPFGFIEFKEERSVVNAINSRHNLQIDSRRIRVELAKRQRKLCIRQRVDDPCQLEALVETMHGQICRFARPKDYKLAIQERYGFTNDSCNSTDGHANFIDEVDLNYTRNFNFGNYTRFGKILYLVIAAVVKFEDPKTAQEAHEYWRASNKEWVLSWINMDRQSHGSNVRTSGLVQLIPSSDGSVGLPLLSPVSYSPISLLNGVPVTRPNHETQPDIDLHAQVILEDYQKSTDAVESTTSVLQRLSFDEKNFQHVSYGTESALASGSNERFEEMNSRDTYGENDQNWLFVGRINSRHVTLDLIREKFQTYGVINYIRLYNRGAIGPDKVPVDSYAIISYGGRSSVIEAIKKEHGSVWLGTTLKCEFAKLSLLSSPPVIFTQPDSPVHYTSAYGGIPVSKSLQFEPKRDQNSIASIQTV